ncbi:RBM7 protein, partial [Dromaius novaehollandiae]|nr:RBM7 protein [Dromaius novaehollandiae]
QAGPVIKVKIPKDRDGKPKQFAFVNFKHEESVPYGMSLLNGIKLFGRPIKIQFRSGSSHASHDGNSSCSPHGAANTSPSGTPHSASNPSRKTVHRFHSAFFFLLQMNSAMWQQSQYSGKYDQPGFPVSGYQHGHSFNHSPAPQMQWRPDLPSALRKTRMSSHPYYPEGRHFGREQRFGDRGPDYCRSKSYEDRSRDLDHHYRGSRDESGYDDRNRDGWSHDYDNRRESYREGKWCPSRH